MYKREDALKQFSEQFIYNLGHLLKLPMARCELWENGTKSLDFTNSAAINYEPAKSLVGDEVDYSFNYEKIMHISPRLAKEYVDILFLDTICYNMDRHTENYGFLRDIKTGEFLAMAPNFDNNIALISNGYPSDIKRKNDIFIHDFIELLEVQGLTYELPEVTDYKIECAMKDIAIDVDKEYVKEFVSNGYNWLAR